VEQLVSGTPTVVFYVPVHLVVKVPLTSAASTREALRGVVVTSASVLTLAPPRSSSAADTGYMARRRRGLITPIVSWPADVCIGGDQLRWLQGLGRENVAHIFVAGPLIAYLLPGLPSGVASIAGSSCGSFPLI
jgi:hypothetical protein